MEAIAQTLESIVGSEGICPAENLDPMKHQQIGQAVVPGSALTYWVAPPTQAALAEVITCAHRNRWRVLPCGSGSKLHWGGLVAGVNLVVSTERLNRLVEHAIGDLTVTAEAGIKFADLQTKLGQAGQFLAIDPAYVDRATLGGIIATGDTGSLRQRYNSVRDMLLGISFIRSDGQAVKAGGRVVKNVAGYDLMKLMTGSYGTLGILTQVTFRVYPQPEASQTVILQGELEGLDKGLQTLLSSGLMPTAIVLLSTQAITDLGLKPGMGLIVRFQSIASSVKQQAATLLEWGQTLGLAAMLYPEAAEVRLWEQLAQPMVRPTHQEVIACKIGVKPAEAIALLSQLEELASNPVVMIHAGIGLGWLVLKSETRSWVIQQARSLCEAKGGYLSMLQAPLNLKQQFDVWGYSGNALSLMKAIKSQFDPDNLLSPHRFVGGI